MLKMLNKPDSYDHKGWMQSDFFWKRALGVYGHYLVGGLMIAAAMLLLCAIVFGIVLGVGAVWGR